MLKNILRLLAVLALCFVLSVLVIALIYPMYVRDYRRTLPNGYEIVRTSAHEVGISSSKPPHEVIITAHVDGYAVIGNLVVGHVSIPDISDVWYEVITGYFVIDTSNDKVFQGLSKKDWLTAMKEHGINNEPTLKRFTRFDKNY